MRLTALMAGAVLVAMPLGAFAGDVSVERGRQVSMIGGCNDCHTVGYNESGGQIDPKTALKGNTVGWQGPWGTTFPANIRLIVQGKTEDEFVKYAKTFKTRPPMPYYNVNALDESDLRSLYQYVKSLGDPGDPAPEAVPPGVEPKFPFVVLVPPQMPKS